MKHYDWQDWTLILMVALVAFAIILRATKWSAKDKPKPPKAEDDGRLYPPHTMLSWYLHARRRAMAGKGPTWHADGDMLRHVGLELALAFGQAEGRAIGSDPSKFYPMRILTPVELDAKVRAMLGLEGGAPSNEALLEAARTAGSIAGRVDERNRCLMLIKVMRAKATDTVVLDALNTCLASIRSDPVSDHPPVDGPEDEPTKMQRAPMAATEAATGELRQAPAGEVKIADSTKPDDATFRA